MSLRRRRSRADKPKAAVDMTSLIDLTFLLLVTFIVTLPALEQGVTIQLPQAKADQLPLKDRKANTVTVDALNRVFLNNKEVTSDELESSLTAMVAEDPDVPVLVRGDERQEYGNIMRVVKILHKCRVRKMALVTVEE
ncbi:MAG: biopolymer transporter ExbD [Kiritimatiellae bacterium]|nr:biopolymer transporter ExbD [Kiritimatiellia bacterium]MBR5457815.1 biopolymer transporter ExbD [Kiritimatiellia bacterium]